MPREPEEFICKVCGKSFMKVRKGQIPKYCSPECKKEWTIPRQRELSRMSKERQRKLKLIKKNKQTIANVNEIARKNGMSYGQYMALQYAKQVQVK